MRRYVAQVNVEAMFPDHLAGIGVEAHHALLLGLALTSGVLQVDAIAHDDRRRAPAVRSFPGKIVTGWGPLHRKILFVGDAIARWPTPFGPIARRNERECQTNVQNNED